MEHLNHIWTDVLYERSEQDREHGGPEHDDMNTQYHWVSYIVKQLGVAVVDPSSEGGPTRAALKFRGQMIKVAALAVASVEWIDRVIEALDNGDEDED